MNLKINSDFGSGDPPMRSRERLYARIGQILIRRIRQRTDRGEDVRGRSFAPYSKTYERYRADRGRTTSVNLQFTGRMLGGLRIVGQTNDTLEVGLVGEELEKAAQLEGMRKSRVFIGVDNADEKIIDREIDRWLDEELSRL